MYVSRVETAFDVVDPVSGAIVASVEGEGEGFCQGFGVGFGSVWTCDGNDVVRIDLAAGVVSARIAASRTMSQGHLVTEFGHVWVLQGDGSTLAGIDPVTNEVGPSFAIPVRGSDVAAGPDGLWVVSDRDDAVVLVDPEAGSVDRRVDGFDTPVAISVGVDGVWVGDATGVHRIDPSSGDVVASVMVAGADGGVGPVGTLDADADVNGVWVRVGDVVQHVDATTGTVDDVVTLELAGDSPGDVLVVFGAVWTSASEDEAVFRVSLDG